MDNKDIIITGISRGREFSPNHEDNDMAIFSSVAEELRDRRFKVDTYTEKEFVKRKKYGNVIFNMVRDTGSIKLLKGIEISGTKVINSAFGIENCYRKVLTRIFEANNIPCPKSIIVSTQKDFPSFTFPCWIKRGSSHTMVRKDVAYVECSEEAEKVFEDFRRRNIDEAVINEHIVGDLIKFYGIYDTGFFYSFYPTEQSHSKFGLELINGKARGFSFNKEQLKEYCEKASRILNVPIYGGDCVITSKGEIKIIDFNDWPSFARCRDIAVSYIADYIQKEIDGTLGF